jgi:hypothetical protein
MQLGCAEHRQIMKKVRFKKKTDVGSFLLFSSFFHLRFAMQCPSIVRGTQTWIGGRCWCKWGWVQIYPAMNQCCFFDWVSVQTCVPEEGSRRRVRDTQHHCNITTLPHYHITTLTRASCGKRDTINGGKPDYLPVFPPVRARFVRTLHGTVLCVPATTTERKRKEKKKERKRKRNDH